MRRTSCLRQFLLNYVALHTIFYFFFIKKDTLEFSGNFDNRYLDDGKVPDSCATFCPPDFLVFKQNPIP